MKRPRRAVARSRDLRLVPLGPEHEIPFLAATRASRSRHRPWVAPPTTQAAFRAYLRDSWHERRRRLLLFFDDPETEEPGLAGFFALNEIVRGALNGAYLGYWAAVPYEGRGLMGRGLGMLCRYAFGSLRLHRLEANIQPENGASLALARAGGFRREGFSPRYLKVGGRWRDHERWALTAEDFRSRSRRA